MKSQGQAARPDWRTFLHLGERLVEQQNAAAQCKLVVETIQDHLHAQAEVWLAEPYFPLPGEVYAHLLPDPAAPGAVADAFQRRKAIYLSTNEAAAQSAFPLISQERLLGVLYARREAGNPFQPEEIEYLTGLAAHMALSLQVARHIAIKNWRYEQLSLVRSVSAQISKMTNLDDLCHQVTALIQATFNYYYVALFTVEAGPEKILFRASAGQTQAGQKAVQISIPAFEGIIGQVVATGEEILARDVRHEPRYRFIDRLPETLSELAIPLKVDDELFGVLDVQSNQVDAFHEMDILVLRALADNVAIAIEDARLYSDVQQSAEQIGAILEISHALTSILELDELLREVVHLIQKHFGYPFVHLFTVHSIRRKIIYRAGSGARSQAMLENELSYDLNDPTGMIPWVARSGQSLLANDVSREPLYRDSVLQPANTQAELTIPLVYAGHVQGVLDIQSDQLSAFSQNQRALLEALAASIAIAIRNATIYRSERWRRQAAESLRDVAVLLSANVGLEKLLDTILSELEHNLPSEASAIWLLEQPKEGGAQASPGLWLAAVHGADAAKVILAKQNSESAHSWLYHAVELPSPTIRRSGDPYGPLGRAMQFPADYSSIAAPMRAGEQVLGILTLAHHTPGRYGSEAAAMTTTFASYGAVAFQNARYYIEAQEQAWISTALLEIAETSQNATTSEDLFATMVRLAPLMAGVQKCAFLVWEEPLQAYALKDWHGFTPLSPQQYFREPDMPALAEVHRTSELLQVHHVEQELAPFFAASFADMYAVFVLPLVAHNQVLGMLIAGLPQPRATALEPDNQQHVLNILQGIAHHTAAGLESIQLLEARQEESYVTAVLLQVAQAVVSQNNLNDILDTIVHLMPILVGIDTCVMYLWDPENGSFTPRQAFSGSHQQETALLQRAYRPGEFVLLDQVQRQNQPFFCSLSPSQDRVEDWLRLPCFSDSQNALPDRAPDHDWLLGFPLAVKGDIFGVMLAKEAGAPLRQRERRLEIITGVAQQTALAIQNEVFRAEMAERDRMERELALARQIQQTFLPSKFPRLHGWELDARWQTARRVGGDFYDVFRLSHRRLGLVIADVSDKGLPAALYMTVARTLIRSTAQHTHLPSAVLEQVNTLLVHDSQDSMFVTAVYAIVSLETGEVSYANAGHNLPLVLRGEDGRVKALPKGGMAMGVMPDIQLEVHHFKLDYGDTLYLYTDGVTDAFAPGGESFGEERLQQVAARACGNPVHVLLDHIEQAVAAFQDTEPASDDMTMLAIRRATPPLTNSNEESHDE
ncbi:MAG: GAF domain-containing protein [Chloroflexi bacterium]|nr:GAF domain-containing protein [Chloroflexota bacterium]